MDTHSVILNVHPKLFLKPRVIPVMAMMMKILKMMKKLSLILPISRNQLKTMQIYKNLNKDHLSRQAKSPNPQKHQTETDHSPTNHSD